METAGQSRLRLLSELSPQERLPLRVDDHSQQPQVPPAIPEASDTVPTEVIVEETATESATSVCLRITATVNPPDLKSIATKADKLDIKELDSGEESLLRESYWVYIPPYKTANAVREASAQLAKAKVRDFLVIRSGEYKHGISLGLFSQRERADRRLQEILALKLSVRRPEIQPRSSSLRGYWMVVQVAGTEEQQTLQSILEADGYQVKAVDCPV